MSASQLIFTVPTKKVVSGDQTDIGPLGLDLDGTIDQAPDFFKMLSQCWPDKVYIITYRGDLAQATAYAASFDIKFTEVRLASSFEDKAKIIEELGIKHYFDDMDEAITPIPDEVQVFKVRNHGNYDGRWLYSDRTGRKL